MHEKNIRRIITNQLKKDFPNWKNMTRKSKKELTREIMIEVVDNYDYSQELGLPIEKLTGIEDQSPSGGIRNLQEMAIYIDNFHSDNLFDFDRLRKPYPEIVDEELQFVDQLLVQRRNPGPQDQVRVQRLCPLYGSMLLKDQVVPTTEDQGVTNEPISEIITNDMALSVPYRMGSEI